MRSTHRTKTHKSVNTTLSISVLEHELQLLIERLSQGDDTAFLPLYQATDAMVSRFAMRLLRDPEAAEEVKSEVYLQVYQQASRYQATRSLPSSWLLMLTRSRAIDRLRRDCAKQQREVPIDTQPLVSPHPDPEMHSSAMELRHVLKTALTTLSQEQRQVIEIAYYIGLSQREIAAKLNQPLGTIKTRLRLGMKALRQQLGPLLTDPSPASAQTRHQRHKQTAA